MVKLLNFIESLVEEGLALERLSTEQLDIRDSNGFTRRYHRWIKNVVEVLAYASMESHLHEAKETIGNGWSEVYKTPVLAGILESAHDLMSNGLVGKIKFLLHAEMFSSTVEQAKALNDTGHVVPAAVLGRIVIESWLRDQAEKSGIEVLPDTKASSINDGLKKASVFTVPRWRQIQAMLDIGNSAAHGKAADFSQADVSKLLEYVEANCT